MGNTKIEIVFFSFNSYRSKMIQRFTNSKWSHVGVITNRDDEKEEVTIHEAVKKLKPNTYSYQQMQKWEEEGTIEIRKLTVDVSQKDFIERAKSYEGLNYDWIAIILITLFRILRLIGAGKIIYKFSTAKLLICSEYIARLLYDVTYKRINFEREYNKPFDLASPADIYNSVIWIHESLRYTK